MAEESKRPYIYTLTVCSKVNGESLERDFKVVSKHYCYNIANAFQSHIMRQLEKDGVLCYYDELYVIVSDFEHIPGR